MLFKSFPWIGELFFLRPTWTIIPKPGSPSFGFGTSFILVQILMFCLLAFCKFGTLIVPINSLEFIYPPYYPVWPVFLRDDIHWAGFCRIVSVYKKHQPNCQPNSRSGADDNDFMDGADIGDRRQFAKPSAPLGPLAHAIFAGTGPAHLFLCA